MASRETNNAYRLVACRIEHILPWRNRLGTITRYWASRYVLSCAAASPAFRVKGGPVPASNQHTAFSLDCMPPLRPRLYGRNVLLMNGARAGYTATATPKMYVLSPASGVEATAGRMCTCLNCCCGYFPRLQCTTGGLLCGTGPFVDHHTARWTAARQRRALISGFDISTSRTRSKIPMVVS